MPLWTVPCLVLLAIGTVWLRLAIVRTTYSIDQTNREIRNLELERQQLELKVTALRSPRRLEQLARTRFGLTQAKSDRIVHLKTPPEVLAVDHVQTQAAAPMRPVNGESAR